MKSVPFHAFEAGENNTVAEARLNGINVVVGRSIITEIASFL